MKGCKIKGMQETSPLLYAKIHPPALRVQCLERERLYRRLHDALSYRLILLSAPPGYGKTTLLAGWLQHGQNLPLAAWYSLDPADNDPVRFWSYVVAALQEALQPAVHGSFLGRGFLEVIRSPQAPPVDSALISLFNELALMKENLVLVLDDYQFITNQSIHAQVCSLIENMPLTMRLVIAARSDPPFPLPLYRVRGWLAELRVNDLQFNSEEAGGYLRQALQVNLREIDVDALQMRTEGWVAGLQIAVLSLSGKSSPGDSIMAFSGDDRFLLDYLREEVLSSQPGEVSSFLHQTAVLDRFNAPLCAELTGLSIDKAQSILEYLDRSNMFIEALDQRRDWYRYHPLFADLLRANLQKKQPDQVRQLRRQAVVWLESHALVEDALEQAYALSDLDRMRDLIEKHIVNWIDLGEAQILESWLDRFPLSYLQKHAMLCLGYGYCALYKTQFYDADRWARQAESASDFLRSSFAQTLANLLRSTVAINQKQYSLAVDLARRALPFLQGESPLLGGLLYLNLGDSYSASHDFRSAMEAYQQAYDAVHGTGNSMLEVIIIGSIGNLYLTTGELRQAERVLQKSLLVEAEYRQRAGGEIFAMGKPLTYLARIYLEWYELDKALEFAERAVFLCSRWQHAEHRLEAILCLARVQDARGKDLEVDRCFEILKSLLTQEEPSFIVQPERKRTQIKYWQGWVDLSKAALDIRRGDIRSAQNWFIKEGISTLALPETPDLRWGNLLVAYWLKTGEPCKALDLAHRLLVLAREYQFDMIECFLILDMCLANHALGQQEELRALMREVLAKASREGYVYMFVQCGEVVRGLLIEFSRIEGEVGREYALGLVARFPPVSQGQMELGKVATSKVDLLEPLTEREFEILHHLAAGMTYLEIAAKLYLSVNTIKTHTKNLYGKLGVNNRLKAIEQARKTGIM